MTDGEGASSNNLASTSAAKSDPAVEAAKAVAELYSFFHRSGVAYTYNEKTASRYYCRACLDHEVEVVREAREKFGQGANAPPDVLRNIALGRIEFYIPNVNILRDHLRLHCRCISRENKARVVELSDILSEAKSKGYQNPYDYGSLYESVQYPKYVKSSQDMSPGSASPARIFAAHEKTLLQRAQYRLENQRAREKRLAKASRDRTETEQPSEAELDYESDDFEEAQRLNNYNLPAASTHAEIDKSKMFDADAPVADEDRELPPDFPSSDLLKALQRHAGDMYAKRGLMSTDSKPKDKSGNSLPSMVQAMDASALIALGILAEELTRAQIVRPHNPQPISDFYERKIDKPDQVHLRSLYGYKSLRQRRVVSKILDKLPEGSTRGLAEAATEVGSARDAEGMPSDNGDDTAMDGQ